MADCPTKFASRQGLAHDGLDGSRSDSHVYPKVALVGRRVRAPLSRIGKAIERDARGTSVLRLLPRLAIWQCVFSFLCPPGEEDVLNTVALVVERATDG